MQYMTSFFTPWLAAAVLMLSAALPLRAQKDTGTITGAVRDSSGAAVPRAIVQARNKDGRTRQGVAFFVFNMERLRRDWATSWRPT